MQLKSVLGVALKKRDEITSNSFSYFTRPEKDKPSVVKATSLKDSVFRMPLLKKGFPKEKEVTAWASATQFVPQAIALTSQHEYV